MKNITTLTRSYDLRVRIFWTLVAIAAAAVCLYIYAVLATIHHTASRENYLERSQSLAARVSELEYSYIAKRNDVSLDVALAQGFTEVEKPLYVSRTRTSLTYNTVSR